MRYRSSSSVHRRLTRGQWPLHPMVWQYHGSMCGRYPQHTKPKCLAEIYHASLALGVADLPARYNVAPATTAPVIRMADVGRVIELMRWGLIPTGPKNPQHASPHSTPVQKMLPVKPPTAGQCDTSGVLCPWMGFMNGPRQVQPRAMVKIKW